MNKVYIDTNIILDLFDENRPFHQFSSCVISTLLIEKEAELYINSDSISNIFYVMRNHMKFSFEKAIEKLELINQSFNIVFGDIYYFENTLKICKSKVFDDYEDAFQYICALNNDCNLIITNNPKDFKNSSIEISTSKELYELWNLNK
jgi:predicted nucleic acid-binding protein